MSERQTLVRSLHDIGLAAWFGGNLMGAVGLNGAAATAKDPNERLKLASAGWAKWAPVQWAAMAVHGIGGVALILGNKARLLGQPEARTNTWIKLGVTGAAIASTVYSGILGAQQAKHADEPVEGATEESAASSGELTSVQRQQRIMQWVTPALTLVLIVLTAQQGEQQRPGAGLLKSAKERFLR